MQPQAPANPAETFAKVPRMEAMEQITWGLFWGPKDGAERRGDLLVLPLQWYSSHAIDIRRAEDLQHSANVVRHLPAACGEVDVSDFHSHLPDQPSGTWLLRRIPRLGVLSLGI